MCGGGDGVVKQHPRGPSLGYCDRRTGHSLTRRRCDETGSTQPTCTLPSGGSVAEWLVCWTQALKGRVQIAVATLSGNSLRQTAHTQCASVHRAAKLVAAHLRIAGVTAGLAESNGSLPPGL